MKKHSSGILPFILFLCFYSFPGFSQDTTVINGYQRFYYPSGILSSEGIMKDGKPDGYWKSYFENGKLKSEGSRKDFELDGTWKFYNEEGKRILEIEYGNGKKNGIRTTYLDKEIIRENFRNDVKEGWTRIYYPDNTLKMEIPFVNGMEQGLAKEYSPDGSIITLIEYKRGFVIDRLKINRRDKNNLRQGKWFLFYDNGGIKQEGNYRDDKKDGYFKDYAENGNLISVSKYINDVLQPEAEEIKKLDLVNEYYPDGKLKSSGTYRNGLPEGIRREYNELGVLVQSFIFQSGIRIGEGIIREDGTRDGHWIEFFPDSTLKSEGNYKDGQPTGEWKYYYPNGKLEQTGKFTGTGKYTGTWKWFYESGQTEREESYQNGKKEGMHTEFSEEGNVIEEGEYVNGLEEGPWFTISGDYMEKGNYRDGMKNGKWTTYYFSRRGGVADTLKSFEGNFIEDNPDGKHFYYWDNGKIKDEGFYIMGKKEGDWIKYNSDGTPAIIINYRTGTEVKYDGVRIKPPFEEEEP
jgi:antitoxin component YwqK of YwqJK toxin-antitoxin module